jgi:hypothetical protein
LKRQKKREEYLVLLDCRVSGHKARLHGCIFLSSCIIEKAEKERRILGFVRLQGFRP